MIGCCRVFYLSRVTKAELRIFIKDHRRHKNLKVLLFRPLFPSRSFTERMNGQTWPKHQWPVCPTRVAAALGKSLVKASAPGVEGCGVQAEKRRLECAAGRGGNAEKFSRSHGIHQSRAARFLQA
jgi:hypothetical protein